MWSYYGSKANVIAKYPKPIYDTIFECFAGSARYCYEYWENECILTDTYPVIIDLWLWLQKCSEKDVLSLPLPKINQTLNDLQYDCIEAKHLAGYIIQYGVATPGLTPSPSNFQNRSNRMNYSRKRIAQNIFKIKHWVFKCQDYSLCDLLLLNGKNATYFIDPPYQFGGHKYKMSNKLIDFNKLSEWCQTRPGQVIVCENQKADWLDFVPLDIQRGSYKESKETIWTNYHTHYNNIQQTLDLK